MTDKPMTEEIADRAYIASLPLSQTQAAPLYQLQDALDAERKAHEETKQIQHSDWVTYIKISGSAIDRAEKAEADHSLQELTTLNAIEERDKLKARVQKLEEDNKMLTSYAHQLSKRMRER